MFTILQIDDLDSNLVLIERLLTRRPGFKVLSAETGVAGLALAQAEHPDLILLDIAMPIMGGQEVLARLKNDPSTADIPVLLFSGINQPEVIDRLLAAGAAGFLAKPFTVKGLYDVIDSFMHAA